MKRLVTLTLAVGLGIGATAAGAPDLEFTALRKWDKVDRSAKTREQRDVLTVRSGTVRTPLVYQDFVLRFDYRLPTADAKGVVYLRSRFDIDEDVRGYGVALEAADGRGRVVVREREPPVVRFAAPPTAVAPGQWVACEVRAAGERLTVSLDGVEVGVADRVAAGAGFVAFRATGTGELELRNIHLAIPEGPTPDNRVVHDVKAEGVTAPTLTHHVGPFFPRRPMDARVTGVVLLDAVVDETGTLSGLRVRHGPHPDLAVAAIECVSQWRFDPGRHDGRPVAVRITVEVAFKLGR